MVKQITSTGLAVVLSLSSLGAGLAGCAGKPKKATPDAVVSSPRGVEALCCHASCASSEGESTSGDDDGR